MARTIEVGGETLLVASMIRRGAALAVDLCVAVFVSSVLLYLVSTQVPLDASGARGPVLAVIFAAGVYLIWARDHVLPSPGRRIFDLAILRPGPGAAAALARPITIYRPPSPKDEYNRAAAAILVVGATSLAGMYLLAFGLKSTTVYQSVLRFTQQAEPYATEHGAPPVLGAVPRALLIGKRRAYVQTSVGWAHKEGSLEYFLEQDEDGWVVREVRMTAPSMYGRFALTIADDDVPAPP